MTHCALRAWRGRCPWWWPGSPPGSSTDPRHSSPRPWTRHHQHHIITSSASAFTWPRGCQSPWPGSSCWRRGRGPPRSWPRWRMAPGSPGEPGTWALLCPPAPPSWTLASSGSPPASLKHNVFTILAVEIQTLEYLEWDLPNFILCFAPSNFVTKLKKEKKMNLADLGN